MQPDAVELPLPPVWFLGKQSIIHRVYKKLPRTPYTVLVLVMFAFSRGSLVETPILVDLGGF